MSRSSRSVRSTAIRVVLSAGLIVAGANACTNGGNIFSSGVDPSDSCGAEHVAFADSKSFYLQEVAQGALFGAFSGAALGALTAATTGGDAGQGALIGAGAGTVAGGVAGYFHARQQQSADEASLANSVYGDISRASQEMDRATTTFAKLEGCRFATADRIKASFRQGTLTREQATVQLAEQKRRFDGEIALARQYGAKMAEQDQQFRFASNSLVAQDPTAQQLVATRAVQFEPAPPTAATARYVATAAVNVRSGPSGSAERLAALTKGQAVEAAGDAADGWRKVTLDNGVAGYVSDRFLAPAGSDKAAVATTKAAAAVATAPPASVRTAQVAMAATETIPQKRAAYVKSVDAAAAQSNLSFNLDQSA